MQILQTPTSRVKCQYQDPSKIKISPLYTPQMQPQIGLLYGQYHALRRARYKRRVCNFRRRPYVQSLPYTTFVFNLDAMDDERVRSKFRWVSFNTPLYTTYRFLIIFIDSVRPKSSS